MEEKREAFVILIVNEWDKIRNTRVLSVEEEWEVFQKHSNDMCSKGVRVQKYRKEKERECLVG